MHNSKVIVYTSVHSTFFQHARKELLPQRWGVVGDDNQLSLALTKGFQSLLITQHKLATFHHKGKP